MPDPKQELKFLLTALQFMTRLPIAVPGGHGDGDLGQAVRYFPVAGVLVGAAAGLVYFCGRELGVPALAAAGVAIATQLLLTGALHEDGLADCADGLGGGATRDRALEIMRDSRIGSYGALALSVSIVIRVAALAALSGMLGLLALIVAEAVGRFYIVLTVAWLPYARETGLASGVAGRAAGPTVLIAAGMTLILALALAQGPGLGALVAGFAAWAYTGHRLSRRLGGYTGDGLGCIQQVTSIAALLVLAASWS